MTFQEAVPIVCITFGHPSAMVADALEPALTLREEWGVEPLILDDSSAAAPVLPGVRTETTPQNAGYAAAVNFAVAELFPQAPRIVFVNPDVEMPTEVLARLVRPADPACVAIAPAIIAGGELENVRSVLSTRRALMMLVAQRFGRQRLHPTIGQDMVKPHSSGWALAGTVVSFDADYLRSHPLDPNMFWVEMSAWARANPEARFQVLSQHASHAGGSTARFASAPVIASRLAAQVCYVRTFGTAWERRMLPVAFAAGRVVQVLRREIGVEGLRQLARLYKGEVSWQHIRSL